MILSASRRTDIPAFYSDWLMNRLKEKYVLVPNPRNPKRLGRVRLSPEWVDCIVFWTKNPLPMMDKLAAVEELGYRFYFQFTLTPYGPEVERGLPPKARLVRAFLDLSRRLGPERMVWRYDPVLVDGSFSVGWHLKQFHRLCGALDGAAGRCVFSFIDVYPNLRKKFRALSRDEMLAVAEGFSQTARAHHLPLFSCCETIDLSRFGIRPSACIDRKLIETIVGCPIRARKDPNQRPACGCIESVDIGVYDTCRNGCAYCYATSGEKAVRRNVSAHDPKSPLLTGHPRGDERITDRTSPSGKILQLSLL